MDGQYFSFPQRPPDEVVPAISKLYSTVHKRIASIVSTATSVATLADPNESRPESVPNSRHGVDLTPDISISIPPTSAGGQKTISYANDVESPAAGDAEIFTFPARKSKAQGPISEDSGVSVLPSNLLLNAAIKAPPLVQTESLTATGNVDYLDSPSASPIGGQQSIRDLDLPSNSIPGFALEREISSESETPPSPVRYRRPSLSREDSISTVLTRLKSGTLSKEFWMKDQNAHACFRCEANFTSENTPFLLSRV